MHDIEHSTSSSLPSVQNYAHLQFTLLCKTAILAVEKPTENNKNNFFRKKFACAL